MPNKLFTPLNISVLTVSDTRTEASDKSGQILADILQKSGHILFEKKISKDDIYQIRSYVSQWIFNPEINVILLTGGTGFAERDVTPEAIEPLISKKVDGFGEIFRAVSYKDIGTSTIQSRTLAGFSNKTLIACLPGSTNACKTGWNDILKDQLDSSHRPCNFVDQLLLK